MSCNAEAVAQATTYPRGFSVTTDWKWPLVPARQLVTLNYGKALKADNRIDGSVPVFGTNGQCGWHNAALVKGPGLILGRKGQGPLGVEWCDDDFWVIDTAYYVTTLSTNVDLKYLYYLIKYIGLNHLKDGTSNPTLSRDSFGRQLFPVPSLIEQKAIADVFAILDKRIAILNEANGTLEAIAQALFQSWFIDFDPVRIKAEGREPEGLDAATAALFPAAFEESALGLIPKGWHAMTLGDYVELTKGCSYKGEGLSDVEGAYMFNLGCFNTNRVFATEKVKRYTGEYRPRHEVVAGDLIIANTDMTQARDILGRPAFVPDGFEPGFISHHVSKVTLKTSESSMADALRLFLFFTLQQDGFRERAIGFATGTTVLALPVAAVTQCPACIPSDSTLLAFAAAVRPLLERIRLNERHAATLEQVRDALLPRIISGQLRLPEAQTEVEEAIA